MTQWLYQIRIKVTDELSEVLRSEANLFKVSELHTIAQKNGTRIVCTFDAFFNYCEEAELTGKEDYPLYEWTKQTITNPKKVSKHLKSFAFYKGNDQVYDQVLADALFEDLEPLLKLGKIEELKKINSNPKNNPQPPNLG